LRLLTPSPELQTQIVEQFKQTQLLSMLHEQHYNMVAYPFSTKYQNSNQWVLEVLSNAMSMQELTDRKSAQNWLKQSAYKPSMLRIFALQRLVGRIFQANVAFDDHPTGDRVVGKIEVATVESVTDFIKKTDPKTTTQTLTLTKPTL
jgi:hypothetical protein